MQFAINGITTYSCFFIDVYYGFFDEPAKNTIILKGISNVVSPKFKSAKLCDVGVAQRDCNISKWLLTSIGWWKPIFSWLYDKLIKTNQQLSVLETGPGHGLMSYLMAGMNPSINLEWIDVSNGGLAKYDNEEKIVLDVGDKSLTVNMHLGEIEDPNFVLEKKYDVIVMTEVFEHIKTNPVPTLQKIASYLKGNEGELFL